MNTLHHLFHAHPWEEVKNQLECHYPWLNESLNDCCSAFQQIHYLSPQPIELEVVLTKHVASPEDVDGDPFTGVTVHGKLQTNKNQAAPHFWPWNICPGETGLVCL